MKIGTLLRQAAVLLQQAGCNAPRLDAELLLMHVCHLKRTDLIVRANEAVPDSVEKDFKQLLQRRIQREPLAYIIGQKEFWSRPFLVTPDVLIPRPETEHLIEAVLERFPDQQAALRFCDIGTGSGCIAVILACEYPRATVVATDISGAALDVARCNAERNVEQFGVMNRITFRQGDMLAALCPEDYPFDAVISNPPYVAKHEMDALEPELASEPRHALTDEQDGLKYLTMILRNGSAYLRSGGYIMLESGLCGLPDTPDPLIRDQIIRDLAGHLRGAVYHLAVRS